MGILSAIEKGLIEIWDDIYEAKLDDRAAPDLGDLLKGEEESIYANPKEFFARTYLTKSIENLIEDIAENLKDGKGGTIYLLTSLFGGGKTHTQIALYHAFNNPESLIEIHPQLAGKLSESIKPIIIVMDGSRADLVPHPKEPYKIDGFNIKTIWGMLAYRLGAYGKIKHLDNEKAPAPDVTLLKAILTETKEPILILMDEIVHYVFNLDKSLDLKDYGEKVLLFLDYLARAIEDTPRSSLVVSIQAEYRKMEGYKKLLEEDMFAGYAGKVLRNLSRESTKIITPVSPDDVAKVLQKRIFKSISEKEAFKAKDELYKKYREHPDIFGVETNWEYSSETGKIATAKDTFPFHPKYIEVLQEFVTRNRDLQKTRDAIRITRKVVRRFLNLKKDATFIMPWHIDLKDNDIRTRILTESHREFADVVSRDIVSEDGRLGSVVECSKEELAYNIATAIFLKTYTYETFKEPLKVFPNTIESALMAFDPETFMAKQWTPTDIKDTLSEMASRLPHFTSESGRYWFTPYPSVIEYVEKKAAEKLRDPRLELYKGIKDHVKDILIRKERRGIEEKGEVFDEKNTKILGYGDLIDEIIIEDKPYPQLVILVKPEINEEEVRNIILSKGKEGRRTYRNSVVVVCPHERADFKSLLYFIAKIKSANEVIESLAEYYTDKDIRNLQERKIKDYIQDNVRLLNEHLLSTLTRIAYPARYVGRDDIKWTVTAAASAIIPQVEAGLKNPATGPKLRLDISVKDLNEFLKMNQNWDLIDGESRYPFKNILDTFYTVTSAPLTTRFTIEQTIKRGIENLDFGLIMDGKLYWKQVGPHDGADVPLKIKDEAEIVPYKLAASLLIENLKKEIGPLKINDKIYDVSYELEIGDKKLNLSDLFQYSDWEKILKNSVIVKREKEIATGFMITLSHNYLKIKPGEAIVIKVSAIPIESYDFPIKLKANRGNIDPETSKPPFEATWNLGKIDEPGEYDFEILATSEDGKEFRTKVKILVESYEEEIETENLDEGLLNTKLIQIMPTNLLSLFMATEALSKLGQEAFVPKMSVKFGDNVNFQCTNIDSKLANFFAQKLREISMSLRLEETDFTALITLKQPLLLDEAKIRAFLPISKKAIFTIKREKNEKLLSK